MTVAQGIRKQTVIKAQTGLGSPASGSGGQILRRNNSVFQLERDTFSSDEIITHEQSTGISYGQVKSTGRLSGLLSPSTYAMLFQDLLRADFAAVTALSGLSLTVAGTGPWTITRGSGSFLTGGVKIGDVVRLTAGSFAAGNLNNNLIVTNVTSTVLTVQTLNGSTLTAEGPIASATVTVVGKKSKAPLTSHTNVYFTIEEWYSDLTKSELFTDCKVSRAEVGLPSTGNATVGFDFLGLGRTLGNSQVLTSPTAETTTPILTAVNGVVYLNGAGVTNVTGATLTIDGTMSHGEAVIGSNYAVDINRGKIMVTGQFTALFDSTTIQALYDGETPVGLTLVVTDDDTKDADFVAFNMSKIKITSDAPDDGEKMIVRTYSFTAEINGEGGASAANDQTILSIQDSTVA